MKIPGPTVDQLIKGVTPIYGEPFRYHVRSRSGPHQHLVDLSENGFYGRCDCEAWLFKYAPKVAKGIPLDNSLQCHHIKLARRHFTETMLRRLWAELHKQQVKPAPRQIERPQPPPRREYQLKPQKMYGTNS